MAMQAGLGVSRILILAGAGYTGTIMLKNGKLSELLGDLQSLVKGIEKSGEKDGDADYYDAIAQQVKRLGMEVRQLASSHGHITVLNGGSGQLGNLSGLIVPVATLGAVGYGYMWWKGLKFSDLMYVTKKSMANAVTSLNKHLEQVTDALSAAKAHLTQRIQHLDDKMETQKEISKAIQNDVNAATENLSQINSELYYLQSLVTGLDGKIGTLEEKQDLANMGVLYLCDFVRGKKIEMPKALEHQLKPSGRSRSITFPDLPGLTGLKEIADNVSRDIKQPATNGIVPDGIAKLEDSPRTPLNDQPRTLLRSLL
ncbi:hypothetical protein Tsubulata_016999 [Turnera subulata]|uniref:DUF1664 domain-containing protein n=1 Tax=Turnera subulata TaxID=218843 RepID=A0A9Q0FJB5_9ROSI|nr:hypothetical protein Tsubulata_016999 [Turnera subulata]